MRLSRMCGPLRRPGTVRFVLIACVVAAIVGVCTSAAHDRLETIDRSVEVIVDTERATQDTVEAWDEERAELLARIHELKAQDRWLEFQVPKYRTYVSRQEQEIARLEDRIVEAGRMRRSLEPFLQQTVDQLEAFVGEDLPFLADERWERIARLRDGLDDYHLELGEKLRRVLEALVVETEYGRSLERTVQNLPLEGVETQVDVFRLGRLALFYLTTDGRNAGYLDRESGQWRELPARDAREVAAALEMVDRRRAMELLNLPLVGIGGQ